MNGRNVRRSGLLGMAGALVVAVVLVAPAFACTELANLSVSPASGGAGTAVTVSGTQFLSDRPVTVHWGGSSGALLASATTDGAGSFAATITVPAGVTAATPAQIFAVQTGSGSRAVPVEFNKQAPAAAPVVQPAPATAPAPTVQAAPAPAAQAPVAQAAPAAAAPAAARTAPQAPARQPVAAPAAVAAFTPPAAAPAAPAPAAAPVAAPIPQVVDQGELQAIQQPVPAQPVVVSDAAAMGGPRTIEQGTPLWVVVPLVLVGLTLFAAASAVVVHEVRARRVRAKVTA